MIVHWKSHPLIFFCDRRHLTRLSWIVLGTCVAITKVTTASAQTSPPPAPTVLPQEQFIQQQLETPTQQQLPLQPTAEPQTPTAPQPPSSVQYAPLPADLSEITQAGEPYILGAGDTIRVDIFDVPEFSGAQYTVLLDGSLNLPWIGKIFIKEMNLDQAAEAIATRYAQYINQPLVTVTLLAPRPLRIGVVGQVNRPGVYTVGAEFSGGAAQRYTVTQAIQAAGGITQMADVRQIEIRRAQQTSQAETINVDLWTFLQAGDLGQDAILRDGDTLYIPQATALTPQEASQLAATTFSPTSIKINVVGEVVRPGTVDLPPNTTLNQAILAAGGFSNTRARRAEVELIRINADGTVAKREIDINFSSGIDEANNPPLRSNDIILVNRSTTARVSDFLNTLLTPINGAFAILRLFGFGL
ncbi:polysaccharide biosynthesis/export family protein [Leptolyngbya sp. AN02str]|uniref:polysaccharide biosynthesis/export family protein n=1 Tax=Leptolyngbya sp. AN02str TaxID=3423363 RepID=UPI003D31D95C